MKHLRLFLVLPFLLAACDSSPVDGGSNLQEGLRFSYSGAINGSFEAVGSNLSSSQAAVAFANVPDDEGGWGTFSALYAMRDLDASNEREFAIVFPGALRAGTFNLVPWEQCGSGNCAYGGFYLRSGSDWLDFGSVSGTLTITSIANNRAQGTFSGSLRRYDHTDTISITNGVFNVPVAQIPNWW